MENNANAKGVNMTEEDEAFNEIERQAKQRKEAIKANFLKPKSAQEFYDELRNGVIEEVAQEIKKFTAFGQDTLDGLAIYIREMKK
jgi:hypothetical protein